MQFEKKRRWTCAERNGMSADMALGMKYRILKKTKLDLLPQTSLKMQALVAAIETLSVHHDHHDH